MGRLVDMPLPRLGETMEEGRIVAWLKQPGEPFRRGEILLEVETDKTVVECPALVDGTLVEHLVKSEDRVLVDAPIARIELASEAPAVTAAAGPQARPTTATVAPVAPVHPGITGKIRASGKARALARKRGVDLTDVKGSGRGGRISSADVLQASGSSLKPRVVLIHGLFADGASFSLLKLMLERSGFEVVAVDLPLHGASPHSAMNLDDAVRAVEQGLPPGELILIGHSLGAVIATRIAAKLDSRVKRLILLSPAGFGLDINGGFIDAMLGARNEDQLLDALQMLGPAKVSRSFAMEQLGRIAARREDLGRFIRSVADNGIQKSAVTLDLARLQMPVTALFSRDDPIVPVHHALAAPPNVEVRIVSGCGHVPHWYRADFIVGLLTS
jgi:pyruvate dehydrogenase E2 component (dihydrolipoamide acetyltransferase)